MTKRLYLHTFQIGQPPKRGEGLRIATTRRPPRGILRSRWRRDGYFDIWLPVVAPSASLIRRTRARNFGDPLVRQKFFESYEREMTRTEPKQTIELLAAIAQRIPIAIGCYCGDESHCHRSRLRRLIGRAATRAT